MKYLIILFILMSIINCKTNENKNKENALLLLALHQSQQESQTSSKSNSSACVYRITQYYGCLENFTGYAASTFNAEYFCDSYKQLGAETKLTSTSCSSLGFTNSMKTPAGNFYDTYSCRFAGSVSSYEVACNTRVYNIFPADTTPPSVASTDPTNGATGVSVNPTIVINFSEGMDFDTITTSTIKLYQGSTQITGVTVYRNYVETNKVYLLPSSSGLSSGTEYTITISTGVKDFYENSMENDYSFSFTTQ
ncbi:MAG: Ig-like domain-containing protein [Leptospiraceae bacterium]|nr:Ig-like domain-containing protein [Leptospiraceae bacterium]